MLLPWKFAEIAAGSGSVVSSDTFADLVAATSWAPAVAGSVSSAIPSTAMVSPRAIDAPPRGQGTPRNGAPRHFVTGSGDLHFVIVMIFAYDLGSPYAWLAAERIGIDEDAEWLPVLLGGVFKSTGRSSWALTDSRAAGIAEIDRRARERGLPPLRWPSDWPSDYIAVMRAAVWAEQQGAQREFALAAFRIHFTQGRDAARTRRTSRRRRRTPASTRTPRSPRTTTRRSRTRCARTPTARSSSASGACPRSSSATT